MSTFTDFVKQQLIRKVPGHFFLGERRKNGYLKLIFTLKNAKKGNSDNTNTK